VRYVISSYAFAREKSRSKFGGLRSVLWRKFDKWSLLGLATHIATITANAIYCRLGLQRTREVPQASIALTISSAMHCFLLIRYFDTDSFVSLIVRASWRSGKLIVMFCIGCIMILVGYFVFGYCLFGTYNINFGSWVTGLEVFIAVVHADSIHDRFVAGDNRPDVSSGWSALYWGIWVFFSITIMFNISMAIFKNVLDTEIRADAAKRDAVTRREGQDTVAELPLRSHAPPRSAFMRPVFASDS
jgi:hypothetical protein